MSSELVLTIRGSQARLLEIAQQIAKNADIAIVAQSLLPVPPARSLSAVEQALGEYFDGLTASVKDPSKWGIPLEDRLRADLLTSWQSYASLKELKCVKGVIALDDTKKQSNEHELVVCKPGTATDGKAIPQKNVLMVIESKATLQAGKVKIANLELGTACSAGIPTVLFGYQAVDKGRPITVVTILGWMKTYHNIDAMFIPNSERSYPIAFVRVGSPCGKKLLGIFPATFPAPDADTEGKKQWLYLESPGGDEPDGNVFATLLLLVAAAAGELAKPDLEALRKKVAAGAWTYKGLHQF